MRVIALFAPATRLDPRLIQLTRGVVGILARLRGRPPCLVEPRLKLRHAQPCNPPALGTRDKTIHLGRTPTKLVVLIRRQLAQLGDRLKHHRLLLVERVQLLPCRFVRTCILR